MKKISYLFGILVLLLLTIQCTRENRFFIDKNRVGVVTNEHKISDLKSLFSSDSLVVRLSEGDLGNEDSKYLQDEDEYLVYSKENGKLLLTIVPKIQLDSTSLIKYVEINNSMYNTEKNLNLNSPFKEINSKYKIDKVETSLFSATLYLDELNATISMRKKDIGVSEFSNELIKLEQIPDMASMNHFTIWFN